ncbi:MAG: transposase, partial [Lachnospiraceae bacterium]|nr:transposase [Lachnospiraceae bacterium]
MFKPESWQNHDEYTTIVNTYGRRLSRNNPKYSFDFYDKERQKLLNLNLDPIAEYIAEFYSAGGRPAKNQAQILRSLILFTLLFNKTPARTSLTAWVRDILPHSISLIILTGCTSADELPPLGSYYDFMHRFWLASRSIYSRKSLLPAGKNGKKPDKIIGIDGKLADDSDGSLSTTDIVKKMENGLPASDNPEAALQKIFFLLAVFPSVRLGLVDSANLTMSGDGTAVVSHASPYGKHLPSCGHSCPYRDTCGRHYSDPDAEWGWDSSKKAWYFGHTLYMLCCRNSKLKTELPLLMKFTSAKRHDSKNFLYAIDDFGRNAYGISPKNICLDSAHDNIPTYKLLERWDINALIDINGRAKASENAPDDITFNKKGHPLCRAGHEMCPWGNDPVKDAHKYRCPLRCGRISSCPYEGQCSPSSYGRTVYIKNHADLRFHPRIPRDSEQYKAIYSERTACERVNDRVLNDYCLQHLKIRGRDHFSFWAMLIGICIHLDARYKA